MTPREAQPSSSTPASFTFSPQEVIGNFDCRMVAGRGPASDTALVVLPVETAEGRPKRARFAVLDANGQVFSGMLPFYPNHRRLGKRADGVVVVGFADLRLNSREQREPGTPEPVHIYADGQLVFATERALDFGVAPDGSSVFVQEPSAGEREGPAPRMEEPVTEVWSRNVRLESFYGRMGVSGNGAWLTLAAWNFQVLDAATGETVFAYPVVGDQEAELTRLASVMRPGATVDEVGQVSASGFRGDRMLLFRRIGSKLGCGGAERRKCLADLRRRGVFSRVVDVYDMRTIALDSQPDFRVEVGPDIPCGAGDFPLRGLQVHTHTMAS